MKSATGLEVEVKGKTSVRVLPQLQVRLDDVTVTNPAAAGQPPLLTAKSLDLAADFGSVLWAYLWPSPERDMTLATVELDEPTIGLVVDKSGKPNWTAAPAATRTPGRGQVSTRLSVSRITIKSGTLTARDERTGAAARLDKVDAFARNVAADRLGEINLKSSDVALVERTGGATMTLVGVETEAQGYQANQLATAKLASRSFSYRHAGQGTSADIDQLAAEAKALDIVAGVIGSATATGATLIYRDAISRRRSTGAEALRRSSRTLHSCRDQRRPALRGQSRLHHSLPWRRLVAGRRGRRPQCRQSHTDRAQRRRVQGRKTSPQRCDARRANAQTVQASDVAAAAGKASATQLSAATLQAASLAYNDAALARAWTFQQAKAEISGIDSSTTAKVPLDAKVDLVWNKERVTGRLRSPDPWRILSGAGIAPAILSLTAARSTVDLDGTLSLESRPVTRAGTPSVDLAPRFIGAAKVTPAAMGPLAQWLGVELPAFARGPGKLDGNVDVTPTRIAMTKGRVEQDGTAATGALTVDVSGPRPLVTGNLATDRFDADKYLGGPPKPTRAATRRAAKRTISPEVTGKDAIKAYLQALLDAPVTQSRRARRRRTLVRRPRTPARGQAPARCGRGGGQAGCRLE